MLRREGSIESTPNSLVTASRSMFSSGMAEDGKGEEGVEAWEERGPPVSGKKRFSPPGEEMLEESSSMEGTEVIELGLAEERMSELPLLRGKEEEEGTEWNRFSGRTRFGLGTFEKLKMFPLSSTSIFSSSTFIPSSSISLFTFTSS